MAYDLKGYYKALGVRPGAGTDEVKKAYNKKQVELHPSGPVRKKLRDSPEYNKLTDEQKKAKEEELDEQIALINRAYSILSDETKKKEYDEGREDVSEGGFPGGFSGFSGFGGFDAFGDIFSQMGSRGRRGSRESRVKDVVCDLKLEMKDVFLGKTSKFRVKTTRICKTCNGKGGKDVQSCGKCKGAGTVVATFNLGIITGEHKVECPDCQGRGSVVKGPPCTECKGKKVVEESKILEVNIRPGVENGEAVVFTKQGNEYPGYAQGDVVFNIHVNETRDSFRVGDDYITTADVDILTALAGGVLYYEHPDGRKLAVKVQPFKDFDNAAIVIPNEGFSTKRGGKGMIYIKPRILVNSGLDRAKLSEYLKPILTKPSGDFKNVSSISGKIPDPEEERGREDDAHGFGFDVGSFASFFG